MRVGNGSAEYVSQRFEHFEELKEIEQSAKGRLPPTRSTKRERRLASPPDVKELCQISQISAPTSSGRFRTTASTQGIRVSPVYMARVCLDPTPSLTQTVKRSAESARSRLQRRVGQRVRLQKRLSLRSVKQVQRKLRRGKICKISVQS